MRPERPLRVGCAPSADRRLLFASPHPDESIHNALVNHGWTPVLVKDVNELAQHCREGGYPVGLIDFGEEPGHVQDISEIVHACNRRIRWIALISRHTLADEALRSLIADAFYDFHSRPPDIERLLVTLGRAHGMASVSDRTHRPAAPQACDDGIVGDSEAIRELRKKIARAAATDATVMIQGESGTGKELAATSIHRASKRSAGPFVPVNCAAIPSTLIHSELFGYERGAFTGAARRTAGKVEAANGGTLFLDEIGDLAPDLQVTLLRFLQQGSFQRLGGAVETPVDVRVVCATHVDLREAVRQGRFREDLFYRINVLEMRMPPLRQRVEDIETLAWHFFDKFAADKQPQVQGFSQNALEAMCRHHWPGNVRELINRIRSALVMSENTLISASDLGLADREGAWGLMSLEEARSAAEREAIEAALPRAHHNMSLAARLLGVSRGTLYRLMQKHGLWKALPEASERRDTR